MKDTIVLERQKCLQQFKMVTSPLVLLILWTAIKFQKYQEVISEKEKCCHIMSFSYSFFFAPNYKTNVETWAWLWSPAVEYHASFINSKPGDTELGLASQVIIHGWGRKRWLTALITTWLVGRLARKEWREEGWERIITGGGLKWLNFTIYRYETDKGKEKSKVLTS